MAAQNQQKKQKCSYEVVFKLDDINEDKLFQYKTVYEEYVKFIKNSYIIFLNNGEIEKAMGIKTLLERLVSDGEFYIEDNKHVA